LGDNGPTTGEFKVTFLKEYSRSEEYAAQEEDEPETDERLPYNG
jgi:hypothetical protein